MGRWPEGAAERLHDAALELFAQQGYAATTVPQIAQRAGLTTRSFFRWYPDKREVLFAHEGELPTVVARVFADAPAGLPPVAVIRLGLQTVLNDVLEPLKPQLLVQDQVIRTDAGLQERYSRKSAILTEAATAGFLGRGLSPVNAELAGRLSIAVFDTTMAQWLATDDGRFADIGAAVCDALSALVAPSVEPKVADGEATRST